MTFPLSLIYTAPVDLVTPSSQVKEEILIETLRISSFSSNMFRIMRSKLVFHKVSVEMYYVLRPRRTLHMLI